jgi:hypothetical protein
LIKNSILPVSETFPESKGLWGSAILVKIRFCERQTVSFIPVFRPFLKISVSPVC